MRPIAVLLEIETGMHDADRCFSGLDEHFTLSVKADEVRDDTDPRKTAERIFEQLKAHREKAAEQGYDAVAVAFHQWQSWRDTIGSEVQDPFVEQVRDHGLRHIQLDTEGCNAHFRTLLDEQFGFSAAS